MSEERTFVAMVLNGDADPSQIEDFVALWHGGHHSVPIHEFLGLTEEEYGLWVEKASALNFILASRRYNCSLASALQFEHGTGIAARSADAAEAKTVLDWLRQTGRVSG